jgi:hypothetical protein
MNRDREPLNPFGGLDLVAVSPVALGVLQIIMKNEYINAGNKIEIAPPRDE